MTDLDRRSFLTTAIVSLGLATSSGDRLAAFAQAAAPGRPHRIDIHHHFAPPAWVTEVKGRPLLQAANTRWTPAQSIEDMDRGGVAVAMVSITNPGLWFGDAEVTRRLARACNDYGAKLVQQYPTRFGLFAAMPLPDVDATLKEIAYAYDTLKVDGVGLLTSYGDTWLGNPAFRPVMEELNRRRAVVHIHPTAANCCRNLAYGAAPGSMEYGTDTTRAIIGVTFGGDAARCPDIRFIWSHAGGSAPFLAGRIDGGSVNDRMPNGFIHEAKKFYYDTAGASNRGALASLLELVPKSQMLFGTDFPPGGSSGGARQDAGRSRVLQPGRPARDRAGKRGAPPASAQSRGGLNAGSSTQQSSRNGRFHWQSMLINSYVRCGTMLRTTWRTCADINPPQTVFDKFTGPSSSRNDDGCANHENREGP